MKNVCNIDLTYAIFLHKQKYILQVKYLCKKKKRVSLDTSKNIQVNLIKIKHN